MLLSVSMELPAEGESAAGLDASPKSVTAWVQGLPRAHLGNTTREIYQALQLANRCKVPLDHRLHFLESVAAILDELMPPLERHFAEANWPLEQKTMRVAQLVATLRQEMAIGYRLVLKGARPWRLFHRASESHARSAARLIRLLSDLIEQCRLLHQPELPGVWSVMHHAFTEAMDHREADLPVPVIGKGGNQTSASREYRRALLLSLLSPADFTKEQWRNVHARLDEWAVLARLKAASQECSGIHCVHTEADIGPAQTHSNCTNCCVDEVSRLHLDTSELVAVLIDPKGPVTAALAEVLVRAWRQPGERGERRTSAVAALDAAFGFTAIHSLMLHRGHAPLVRPAAASDAWVVDGSPLRVVDDVWGAMFIDVQEYQRSNWAQAFGQQKEYETQPVRVRNSSDSGYCLHLPARLTQSVRVGDVVGFQDATEEWEIAAVRWVQTMRDGNGMFGVRRLLSGARAVVLRVVTDGRKSDPLPGFAGSAWGMPALLVPYLPGQRKRFVLDHGTTSGALLTDGVLSTGTHYVVYKFHVENSARPDATRAARAERDAEFAGGDDVWNQL